MMWSYRVGKGDGTLSEDDAQSWCLPQTNYGSKEPT